VGDRVKKGDLLAVVWSKDLGEKKSELVDALSKLRADRLVLKRANELYSNGSGPERNVYEAERAVESSRVAVARAERTLRAWGLTEAEVAAVSTEADRLARPASKRGDPSQWARVEVRSPRDGAVLERNLAIGDLVDPTTDLFKVGDLSQLVVWAHVYEEDLPLLQALPTPVGWKVRLAARPGASFAGTLEQVGEIIDPTQHTALVSGRVDNPDGALKVGQFVTVTVALPPPAGEVELPADAVVEDGRESVVFVEADGKAGRYARRKVRVVRRLRDAIYVRAETGGPGPGQRVVTAGALLLREAMESLPGQAGEATVRGTEPARSNAPPKKEAVQDDDS
jgi:cobalt-zinc-cadmium efflux system membrane fusion protein